MRFVLTSDTRVARAELLGEVDIVEGTRRGRLVMRVETRSTYTHEATCSGRQQSQWLCHSGCRAIRNRKGVSSCTVTVTKHAVQPYSTDHGAKAMGSGTRMTNFCVVNQPTLQSATWKPFPTKLKSSAWTFLRSSLEVISQPQHGWVCACVSFHHIDIQCWLQFAIWL